MKLADIHSFRDFISWITGIPGLFLTAIKEDGEDSPLSSRRIALMATIFGAWQALKFGLQSALFAAANGAEWKIVALMLAPFALCVITGWAIVTKITATDIQQLLKKRD